jgi:hypothetical protein
MTLGSHTTARKTRLLEVIRQHDIKEDTTSDGIFSFDVSVLRIWCHAEDHPGGPWSQYRWFASPLSQLTKPGAWVVAKSMLLFSEAVQDSIGSTLHTDASTLADQDLIVAADVENRAEDVAWATQKLVWLWAQAFPNEPPPHIRLEWGRDQPKVDYLDRSANWRLPCL